MHMHIHIHIHILLFFAKRKHISGQQAVKSRFGDRNPTKGNDGKEGAEGSEGEEGEVRGRGGKEEEVLTLYKRKLEFRVKPNTK